MSDSIRNLLKEGKRIMAASPMSPRQQDWCERVGEVMERYGFHLSNTRDNDLNERLKGNLSVLQSMAGGSGYAEELVGNLLGIVEEVYNDRNRWRTLHHQEVERSKLLKQRLDLPVDRVPAYEYVKSVQLMATPARQKLRDLVDTVWQHVKESEEVPATSTADELIGKVFKRYDVL